MSKTIAPWIEAVKNFKLSGSLSTLDLLLLECGGNSNVANKIEIATKSCDIAKLAMTTEHYLFFVDSNRRNFATFKLVRVFNYKDKIDMHLHNAAKKMYWVSLDVDSSRIAIPRSGQFILKFHFTNKIPNPNKFKGRVLDFLKPFEHIRIP